MGSVTDGHTVSTRTGTLRTILVVVALVVSAASIGVLAVTGPVDGSDAPGSSDAVHDGLSQEETFVSGSQPLADANTTFSGASANDSFGSSLARGDLNGDGVADVVVGAPRNDSAGGNNSGAVYVFYGPVDESELEAENADATLHGVESGDRAGYSVATGDVDADGADDLVVGAPLEDFGAPTAGAAYVLYGDELPENASLSAANHTLVGESEGDRAGWSVATVNRSGGDDVLVGAPQNNSDATDADANGDEAGAAYVVSDLAAANGSLANASAVLTGEAPGDRAGWSVADAGDFDGDGSTDILVSAPRNNSTGEDAGAAYVVTENVSGTVPLADAELKFAGDGAADRAGWATAGAGDVNGDGYDDVVVGAPFAETADSETNAGVAYVVYGGDNTGTANLSDSGAMLVGEGRDDFAGYDVAGLESSAVNCDDFADVLVGAPGNNSTAVDAGAAYVVAGSQYLPVERGLSTADAKLRGEGEGDLAGRAVADAGNASGNGTAGALVGAPFNDSSDVDAGAAYLVAGSCPEPKDDEEPEAPATTDDDEGAGAPDTTTKAQTTTEAPTTTTTEQPTTTTTTEEPPLDIDASSPECGVLRLENPTDKRVYVHFVFENQPSNEGEIILEPGETDERSVGDNSIRLTASTGGMSSAASSETVLINGEEEVVVDVDACEEEQPPSGSIVDVTCQNVTVAADNVNQGAVTFLVEFEDGTNTTETVETDNGSFSGTVPFDNPDNKNISGVFLYAGNDTDTEPEGFLDDVDLDGLSCVPEYDPEGRIVDSTCQNVTIEVEDVPEGFVTIVVGYEDDTTENITVPTDNGSFSGTVPIENPDNKNISTVDLFAGEPGEGPGEQFIDDRDPFHDCSPEEQPEPSGNVGEVDCDSTWITASNVSEENVTIQVEFEDGNTTTTTVDVDDDGTLAESVSFDNDDYRNVTRVSLYAGSEVDSEQLLDERTNLDIDCEAPVPDPEGNIGEVDCDSAWVSVSNVQQDEVTLSVEFEDGSSTNTTVDVDDDGTLSESVSFDNTDSQNVTAVRLYAGSAVDSEQLLDERTDLDTTCAEPSPECPSGLAAKWNAPNYDLDTLEGTSELDVTISGDAESATVTNNEDYDIEVWVFAASGYEQKGTVSAGGTLMVEGIEKPNGDGRYDISNIAVVCVGEGPPDIPPYNNHSPEPAAPANFDVAISGTSSPVTVGDALDVDVYVENTGDEADTQDIELQNFDGDVVDTQEVALDSGASDSFTLTWTTETGDAGAGDIEVNSDDDSDTNQVNVQEPTEPAFVDVTLQTTNSPVTEGEDLDVEVYVENTGDEQTTQTVELRNFDGDLVDEQEVTLDGGGSDSLALTWTTESGDAGAGDIEVSSDDDSFTQTVNVQEPAAPANFDVEIDSTNEPVTVGDDLDVDVSVENTGELEGTQTVALEVGGEMRGTQEVTLDGGKSTTITMSWGTSEGDAGNYRAVVSSGDDSDAQGGLSVEADTDNDATQTAGIAFDTTPAVVTTPSLLAA